LFLAFFSSIFCNSFWIAPSIAVFALSKSPFVNAVSAAMILYPKAIIAVIKTIVTVPIIFFMVFLV